MPACEVPAGKAVSDGEGEAPRAHGNACAPPVENHAPLVRRVGQGL